MYSYIYQFRLLELSVRKVLSGRLLGNYKSAFHGRGLEFQEFRSREEGEDSSNIDWLISSREGRIIIRKMQEERNLSVLQIVDTQLFAGDFLSKEKKEVLEKFLFFTSLSAVENSDRVGMYLSSQEKMRYFPYSKKKAQLFQVYTLLQKLAPQGGQREMLRLSHLRVKNNLVFYYTDSFDIDFNTLKIIALKNDVVVVHIFHSFENTLQGDSQVHFLFSSFAGETLPIDTIQKSKREEYETLRKEKISNFSQTLRRIGVDYISLDEKSDVAYECVKFMKKREELTRN